MATAKKATTTATAKKPRQLVAQRPFVADIDGRTAVVQVRCDLRDREDASGALLVQRADEEVNEREDDRTYASLRPEAPTAPGPSGATRDYGMRVTVSVDTVSETGSTFTEPRTLSNSPVPPVIGRSKAVG